MLCVCTNKHTYTHNVWIWGFHSLWLRPAAATRLQGSVANRKKGWCSIDPCTMHIRILDPNLVLIEIEDNTPEVIKRMFSNPFQDYVYP